MTLPALRQIRDPGCRKCPLWEGANHVCLMGYGAIDARLAIIGEAPGYMEDQAGKPFVGAAGARLDDELKRAGLARSDVFTTNVVRCRPEDNRTPSRAEMKACKPYLDAELAVVKPEVVLLLGNSALQSVLGMSGITKKRGAAIERDGITYLPTFHPAAVLRNPTLEQDFRTDLMAVSRLLAGTNEVLETQVALVRDPSGLLELCSELKMLPDGTNTSFDVETASTIGRKGGGLEPWAPDSRLDTVAFCWEEGTAWALALEHPEATWGTLITDVYDELGKALKGKRLIAHNGKFDAEWLASRGIHIEIAFDTLAAAHLLDENRSNGLKPLSRTYLGASLYEDAVSFNKQPGEENDLDTLLTYNGQDADNTLRLYNGVLKPGLVEAPRLARIFKFLSMPAVNALARIEMRGFPVDVPRLRERHAQCVMVLRELESAMLQHVEVGEMLPMPNFRSPVFLNEWLFGQLGLPVLAISPKTNQPSTAIEVLSVLRKRHEAVELLLQYRKWSKWEGTYTRSWMEQLAVNGTDRLHPSYNIAGTVTGRLSSNFQQVPRDPFIRGIIGAPEGWRLIDADFSQVELRIAAMLSGDRAMIQAFNDGADLHRLTAAAITGKSYDDVTKEDRQIAKACNFGMVFGLGATGFRIYSERNYGVEMSDDEAIRIRNAFFDAYPSLQTWYQRQRRLVNELGEVTSPIGRVRRLPAIRSGDRDMRAEAERQSINSPVQGLASDLTVLAMSTLEGTVRPERGHILGNLHDSIILEVREEYADEVAAQVKQTMESLPLHRLFAFTPSVPLIAETKIVTHWGEAA